MRNDRRLIDMLGVALCLATAPAAARQPLPSRPQEVVRIWPVQAVDDGACARESADRNEPMDPDPWPRRPRPETTGPHFDYEISQPSELRSLRVGLRTWVPATFEESDSGVLVLEHVLLVVDELATNGLRHGEAPVRV